MNKTMLAAAAMAALCAIVPNASPAHAAGAVGAEESAAGTGHSEAGVLLAATPGGALMDEALRAIAMTRSDLTFRTDYADAPDSFRLSAVDSLLTTPLLTEQYVMTLADALDPALPSAELVRRAALELDVTVGDAEWSGDARPGGNTKAGGEADTDRNAEATGDAETGGNAVAVGDAETGGNPEAGGDDPIELVVEGLRRSRALMESAFARLSLEERLFVAEHAAELLKEEEFDPDRPIEVRDRESREEEEIGDELLRVAGLVDRESIARAAFELASSVDRALPMLRDWDARALTPRGGPPETEGTWDGDVLLVFESDVGTVVVGGPGPTVYRGRCALSIDLGGDDMYLDDATSVVPGTAGCVTIDLSGDDLYVTGDHSAGAGFMSIGILVDAEGDDLYSAGSFSQGSGLFGAGLLTDVGGNDRYSADTCTQGSGAFGLGLLVDREGNDSYGAALFSQAFGFVGGLGALVDADGNDHYFAGGKYTDEIRYFDHYLSLSQGFAYGWRPDASGGIALLADSGGNDVYVSDIFGQGSSYWFAVAGLVDRAGNDEYVSYQYAQGAGTHITVAALVDMEGDDNYVSKGVSQGCGHDLAIGILHDLAGDDSYTCHDLSQGAGNANGIGVIIDDAGDDAYAVRNPANTNGYGNHRRDYGSVGIHLDAAGTDSYSGRGADGEWWIGSDHGIGVDHNEFEEVTSQ